MKRFPFYRQLDQMDCGPTCLLMITRYFGIKYSLESLRKKSFITREGVSLLGISNAAEDIGFRTIALSLTFEELVQADQLPCIVHWKKSHFIVIYKIKKQKVYIADPGFGLIILTKNEFSKGWLNESTDQRGVALFLEPTPDFYKNSSNISNTNIKFLSVYFFRYKSLFIQLSLGLFLGTVIQIIIPFLSKSIVDIGIKQNNLSFIILIFIAQLVIFISQIAINILRSWILLHIGTRINISLISDFLIKLMKLPISFFESKVIGDLLQRINDHHRIEVFMTSTALSTLFSMINLLVFSFILFSYNLKIFIIFNIGSIIYLLWVWFFLKQRRELDYKTFEISAGNQSNLVQMITAMQEIKLHNAERKMRRSWELIQATLFKTSIRSLTLDQIQNTGAIMINESKNLLISFLVAKAVLEGQMTLGMMVSVQYIIGNLNTPLDQFIRFIRDAQDATISLERLREIHGRKSEENEYQQKLTYFPGKRNLELNNVSFSYEGPKGDPVLKNISLKIPEGKVTAIVGTSGSGKTTLMKLLLKFFEPTTGEINVDNISLDHFNSSFWRGKCGAVLQEGYIFSDNIANNIAFAEEQDHIDYKKLEQSIKIANIKDFINDLPAGLETKIGSEGMGLSQGQKQRILIARAIYKNPDYFFLDEATNNLDTNNERQILDNLNNFYKNRTVVVIAHRLSTVMKADQIIVLDKGELVEIGRHEELISSKGRYFSLVKNQLELDK